MNRWIKYALIGLGFGILDWYYLDLLAHFPWGPAENSILVVPVILSYYTYYTVLLSLGVLPNLQHLGIFGERYPGFWQDWSAMFQRIIAAQVVEWLPIAVIGGAIVGALVQQFYRYWAKRRARLGAGRAGSYQE